MQCWPGEGGGSQTLLWLIIIRCPGGEAKRCFISKYIFFYKWAGLRLRKIKTFGNKAIISFWGTRHFFKPCKDQITDILIFGLIFTSDIKTLHLFANLIFYKLPKLFLWEFLELIPFFCFENFLVWSLKEIRY